MSDDTTLSPSDEAWLTACCEDPATGEVATLEMSDHEDAAGLHDLSTSLGYEEEVLRDVLADLENETDLVPGLGG